MRRLWGALLTALAILLGTVVLPHSASATKYAALVQDVDTGRVLFSRHADSHRYPASLTKIMTLYLLFEAIEQGRVFMDTEIPVSPFAASEPPSKLGLRPGETITVRKAIEVLVIKSANDVATAIGEFLGGSEAKFARIMTQKAREFGMSRTTFKNAHGLPDPHQRTTARDMAKLAIRMIRDFPQYYSTFSKTAFQYNGRTYKTHNNLLKRFEGMDGMKTGYIRASGFNLASSAKRNGRHVIGIVFGGRTARSRDNHMANILTSAFARLPARPTHQRLAFDERPLPRGKPETGFIPVAMAEPTPNPLRIPSPQTQPKDRAALASLIGSVAQSTEMGSADGVASESGEWAIQIGAFRSAIAAQSHAETVRRAYPALAGLSRTKVVLHDEGRTTLYRSRLVGFDETSAADACAAIGKRGITCVLVAPDGTFEVAEY